jgi:hypothetical protein
MDNRIEAARRWFAEKLRHTDHAAWPCQKSDTVVQE